METGGPNVGHFARNPGRSAPLWSLARTGFILAVCTPVALAPVPAAAGEYYPPPPFRGLRARTGSGRRNTGGNSRGDNIE